MVNLWTRYLYLRLLNKKYELSKSLSPSISVFMLFPKKIHYKYENHFDKSIKPEEKTEIKYIKAAE